jgi:5-carboxymethyl-2-hydroxymuconate isomerase
VRFLSFARNGKASFGAVIESSVVDLGAAHPELPDLRSAMRENRLAALGDEAVAAEADCGLQDIEFLPTIPNPEKIICIGVNYANRNEEYKDGTEPPKYPSVFMRTRESLVGHGQNIMDPPESEQLDYEGEIVIVIGKEGRRIAESEAHNHVAGLTIMRLPAARKIQRDPGQELRKIRSARALDGRRGRTRSNERTSRHDSREWRGTAKRHNR